MSAVHLDGPTAAALILQIQLSHDARRREGIRHNRRAARGSLHGGDREWRCRPNGLCAGLGVEAGRGVFIGSEAGAGGKTSRQYVGPIRSPEDVEAPKAMGHGTVRPWFFETLSAKDPR